MDTETDLGTRDRGGDDRACTECERDEREAARRPPRGGIAHCNRAVAAHFVGLSFFIVFFCIIEISAQIGFFLKQISRFDFVGVLWKGVGCEQDSSAVWSVAAAAAAA